MFKFRIRPTKCVSNANLLYAYKCGTRVSPEPRLGHGLKIHIRIIVSVRRRIIHILAFTRHIKADCCVIPISEIHNAEILLWSIRFRRERFEFTSELEPYKERDRNNIKRHATAGQLKNTTFYPVPRLANETFSLPRAANTRVCMWVRFSRVRTAFVTLSLLLLLPEK